MTRRPACAAAGIDVPDDIGRKLAVVTSDGTQLLFLRPSDVPAYVEFGAADCGIVGKDVLWETDRVVSELADLAFGYCRLCVAARRIDRYHEGAPFPTFLRVATKFAALGRSLLRRTRSAGRAHPAARFGRAEPARRPRRPDRRPRGDRQHAARTRHGRSSTRSRRAPRASSSTRCVFARSTTRLTALLERLDGTVHA